MKRIYKYLIPIDDRTSVRMPGDAEILSVGSQGDDIYVWAAVTPSVPDKTFYFDVRGTGHPLGNVGGFIGTVHMRGLGLVFHVFHSTEMEGK